MSGLVGLWADQWTKDPQSDNTALGPSRNKFDSEGQFINMLPWKGTSENFPILIY